MRYQISGKQIDIGEALQTHVKAEMGEVIEKYAQRPTECIVVFSRVAHEFVCESVIHLSTGLTAQAKGHAGEIYAAFEFMPREDGQAVAPLQATPAQSPS